MEGFAKGQPMTQTITLWPIIKALFQAALFLSNGTNVPNNWYTQWHTLNETQQQFVHTYLSQHVDLAKFKPDELKAWAAKDYQELNAILAKEHFAIQLQPFPKNGFGVVAILDVMMEWQSPGTSKKITAKNTNTTYAGVEIERGFTVFTSNNHAHPIACIKTKSGDTAWLTIADKPKNDFDILQQIDAIKKNLQPDDSYQSIMFPKIDLDQQPDITWLLRMSYSGYFIAQALQQTKLKMNEFGAHVQSAVAIAMMRSMPPTNKKVLMIDRPFFCWIEKPGISIPIFAGYLDTDVWKDPGSLDMKAKDHKETEEPPVHTEHASWWLQIKNIANAWWSKVVNMFS